MKWLPYSLIFVASILAASSYAQLSPGPLSRPHQHLEGLFNCMKCHAIGSRVPNEKCLACHKDVGDRIVESRGYHASSEVSERACFNCHSDHHGRNFDLIHFEQYRFQHDLTGYTLEGKHAEVGCRDCHNGSFVVDKDAISRESTFFGLDTKCISCHEDPHSGKLPAQCQSCHDLESFSPASLFDHAMTDFALEGKHSRIDCRSCHSSDDKGKKDFQEFEGIFQPACSDCHDDVHGSRFGTDCSNCHNEWTFYDFTGADRFDHNLTGFQLKGQHQSLNCTDCHKDGTRGTMVFEEYRGKEVDRCSTCHVDVHNNKFGKSCTDCHSERSFRLAASARSSFEHDKTEFPLEGMHETVDCKYCHRVSFIEPLLHGKCTDCHFDYHDGQFDGRILSDCADCHTVNGFSASHFSIEDHLTGTFPLTGAHLATPCNQCHLREDRWTFRNMGTKCNDCHENIHLGTLDEKFYPSHDCKSCHFQEDWHQIRFDHNQTDFVLQDTHLKQDCRSCHGSGPSVIFKLAIQGADCSTCHGDTHYNQFARDGKTNCIQCHGFDTWRNLLFDHDSTQFPLEGRHLNVSCDKCHMEIEEGQSSYIIYKIENFECASCHL